jgi:cell division protease FtsH
MQSYQEKKYSDETAQKIDAEVRRLTEEAHERARQILLEKKEKVQLMADMLMEFETLDAVDVREIMDGTWDVEKKRSRLKAADELQRRNTPPPLPAELRKPEPPAKGLEPGMTSP